MTAATLHHISGASLCPLGARFVDGTGGAFSRGRMVCHCWLVESQNELILVDTGIGRADLEDVSARLGRWFKWLVGPETGLDGTAWAQIRALGFDPRDVRHIIPTHLDLDHAGGLPDFPDADVHVVRAEYDAAMKRAGPRERSRYRPEHWAHGPRWVVHEPEGEAWFGFRGVRALGERDDILLIPLFGHSPGHCGVAIRVDGGWRLHAGDAYFFHAEMNDPPRCTPGLSLFQRAVAVDNRERLRNQARLRELLAKHGADVSVHSSHCAVEFERFASGAPSGRHRR